MVAGSSGAGKRNCFWEVAHSYLAYVDCETGVVYADGGMLVYPMNDEEYAAGYVLGRFCGAETYRVMVRQKITEEGFAQRLDLTSIALNPDGPFSAYFDDDDMFCGHCVVVYGTLVDGVTSAVTAG